jgi:glycosyltransferase involved in cell wall biosynthesis
LFFHENIADGIPAAEEVNLWLMRSQLQTVLKRMFSNAERLIEWIYYPVQRWVWDIFPSAGKIYECYDEYARSPRGELNPRKWQRELRVITEADLTFATARSLVETRAAMAGHLAPLANGVPDSFFEAGQELTPDPIDAVPHPRIGYVGNIRSVLDFRLLEELFLKNPQWQLVLVGPIQKGVPIENLRRMKNVHFLGPRPHDRVPGVLRRMDVGLIPFVVNEFTRAINPLKVYEYLAVGLAVVASPLPELERFRGLVSLQGNDPAEFAWGIKKMLSADRASLRSQSLSAARPYSWSNIARQCVVPVLKDVFDI